MNDRFRSAALALRPHVSDTYSLLAAADDVVSLIETEVARVEAPGLIPHWFLVRVALNDPAVMEAVKQGKRINAIKALREVGINGVERSIINLRQAKEAIEDPDVEAHFNAYANDPWSEPPF